MWILLNVFLCLQKLWYMYCSLSNLLSLIILKLKTVATGYFTERWSVGAWFRYVGNNPQIIPSWKGGEAICEVTFGGREVFNIQKISACAITWPTPAYLQTSCCQKIVRVYMYSVSFPTWLFFIFTKSIKRSLLNFFHLSPICSISQNCTKGSRSPCSHCSNV